MNRKVFPLFAALGTLVFAAASFAFAPNKDVDALKALDAEWSKAAQSKNLDKLASYYADDAVAYPPDEPAAVGKAAARKVWASYLALPAFQISWKSNAAGADGNTGYTAGTFELSYKSPDGKTVTEKGKYVCVYRKGNDGKWKAIHDIWNGDSK